MATQIFNSYYDFLMRKDEKINGVSKEFSIENPLWKEQNATNVGCWNCSSSKYCVTCKECSGSNYCVNSSGLVGCFSVYKGCNLMNCQMLYNCVSMENCVFCSNSSHLINKSHYYHNEKFDFSTPVVEDLEIKILSINDSYFDYDVDEWCDYEEMDSLASIVLFLAGDEGDKLAEFFGEKLAAAMIFENSNNEILAPYKFYASPSQAIQKITA